jgi:hypothetical protein
VLVGTPVVFQEGVVRTIPIVVKLGFGVDKPIG